MSAPPPSRVLVVDDNKNAADTLATLVRLLGHNAIAAYDGISALEIAQIFKPDVILLDLVMPDVDGFAVARLVRKLRLPAKIIALTAFTQPAFLETADVSGFDSVVAKPATADQLISLLMH
jgi:CheY-like chemotaxis protein